MFALLLLDDVSSDRVEQVLWLEVLALADHAGLVGNAVDARIRAHRSMLVLWCWSLGRFDDLIVDDIFEVILHIVYEIDILTISFCSLPLFDLDSDILLQLGKLLNS